MIGIHDEDETPTLRKQLDFLANGPGLSYFQHKNEKVYYTELICR